MHGFQLLQCIGEMQVVVDHVACDGRDGSWTKAYPLGSVIFVVFDFDNNLK